MNGNRIAGYEIHPSEGRRFDMLGSLLYAEEKRFWTVDMDEIDGL